MSRDNGGSPHNADWAFARYESVRATLPFACFGQGPEKVASLAELADDFDVFLLDAFGVLNVGETAIQSAPARVLALQKAGKRVLVLSNGATYPADAARAKYARLGFHFALSDVVSSRDALALALVGDRSGCWGAMAVSASRLDEFPVPVRLLGHQCADFDAACGFLLLSTNAWDADQQEILCQSLAQNPRPVLVGNPDIVAPREAGLSLEPGHFAHQLVDLTGVVPQFFGKPFGNVYDLAFSRLGEVDKSRVLMVGDSLHTDILGGAAYGIKTALVTGHGLLAGRDPASYIARSGIRPDFILASP